MDEYPTKRFEELMHLVDGSDGRAKGEHNRVLESMIEDLKSNRQQPRMELEEGDLIFKDRTGAIVAKVIHYGPETLENLENAYLRFQVAYEDAKSIFEGTYLQWSKRLMEKGLKLSYSDEGKIMALNDRFKGFRSA